MAIPKLLADLAILSKLAENPRQNGLSAESFKKKFDEAPLLIQKYLNDTLIPELDKLVDVEALLKSVLDPTLTKNDMAARADVVGQKLAEVLMRAISTGAAMFENTMQSGDYVLRKDQNFEMLASGAYKFRIGGGAWVMQGNYCEVNIGGYSDVTYEAGATGLNRHDLICARYSRDENGNVTNSLVLIPGEPQTASGVDPAYNSDDINTIGAVTRDLPLYRLVFSGTSVSLTTLFEAQRPIQDRHFFAAATLAADGWDGDTAPYRQTVAVDGVTENGSIHVSPVYPDEQEVALALRDACACITHAKRGVNSITFICLEEKPETDISIEVEVLL